MWCIGLSCWARLREREREIKDRISLKDPTQIVLMERVFVCPSYHSSDDIMARGGCWKSTSIRTQCFKTQKNETNKTCTKIAKNVQIKISSKNDAREGVYIFHPRVRNESCTTPKRQKHLPKKNPQTWGAPHHSSVIHWHRLGQLASSMGSWRFHTNKVGPLLGVNGVIAPINGQKYMGNCDYNSTYRD